jgi:hypothetical protein
MSIFVIVLTPEVNQESSELDPTADRKSGGKAGPTKINRVP